jgi:radical SAM-linked protein
MRFFKMMQLKSNPVRYRVCVSRLGDDARQLSHLAQIELLRRSVLKSGLPAMMDKKRKRPKPRLAFGPAISVGHESLAEYFDLELSERVDADAVRIGISKALDSGFDVTSARRIPRFFPSLDASINVVRYEIRGRFVCPSETGLDAFLKNDEIVIEKIKDGGARVERVDARPLIIEMRQDPEDTLHLTLRFGPKRTVKPEAVLRAWLGESQETAKEPPFNILRKELLSETSKGELIAP